MAISGFNATGPNDFRNDDVNGRNIKAALAYGVASMSLGYRDSAEGYNVVIPENTPIPCKQEIEIKTSCTYYISMELSIYKWNANKENIAVLGKIDLVGMSDALKGVAIVKLCFEIDTNRILNVSAAEKITGLKKSITIRNWENLPQQGELDIKRMVRQAPNDNIIVEGEKKTGAKDMTLKNRAYNMKTMINNGKLGSKLGSDRKRKFEDVIDQTITWLNQGQQVGMTDDGACEIIMEALELILELILEEESMMKDGSGSGSSKKGKGVAAWIQKHGRKLDAGGVTLDVVLTAIGIPFPLGTVFAKLIQSFK